jgi:hypothetical protein
MTAAHPPFESEEKVEMRRRCEVAVDQAGHKLVDVVALELPDSGLRGALKGDLRSMDGSGVRYCYCIRPLEESAPPKWIINMAAHVRKLENVKLVVVYEQVSPELERACAEAGLGVLILESDDSFRVVVDFDQVLPAAVAEEMKSRVDALRRDMERRLRIALDALSERNQSVAGLTANMPPKEKSKYLLDIEQGFRVWDDWSSDISKKLDGLGVNPTPEAIASIEVEIVAGPSLSGMDGQ